MIPLAIDEPPHKARVTYQLIIVPAEKFGGLFSELLVLLVVNKTPIDVGRPVVFFYPFLLDFHQVLGVVSAVFFFIFFEQLLVAMLAGLFAGFYPAGAIPIDAAVGIEIFFVSFF